MASERDVRRRAYIEKSTAEVRALAARGVVMGGNAFSPVLLAKGEAESAEAPFPADAERALKASLAALGYEPQDWETLLTCDAAGQTLEPDLLREAVTALDPQTVVLCDDAAAAAMREAYADELASIDDLEEAMLGEGALAHVAGMRVLCLGDFAGALADAHLKQVMWARLKRIPPMGEPY